MKKTPVAIRFSHVTKQYKLYSHQKHRLVDYIIGLRRYKIKVANNDLSFIIRRGESVAILGENGAGKSTLMKMITGVTYPTTGKIKVRGRVSALLELTAGFDAAFTGRENIYIKGMLMGIKKSRMRQLEDKIVDFADIGEYIDQPVRTYSSGMKARLGFAINAYSNPDILIIDEALSVGDRKFRRECKKKIRRIRSRQHVTVLLVTHSLESAKEFCQRGIVLEKGSIVFDGPIQESIDYYSKMTA